VCVVCVLCADAVQFLSSSFRVRGHIGLLCLLNEHLHRRTGKRLLQAAQRDQIVHQTARTTHNSLTAVRL